MTSGPVLVLCNAPGLATIARFLQRLALRRAALF